MRFTIDGAQAGRAGLAMAAAAAGLVLAALPVFLVGGLAVQIRAELGFSESALGVAVTAAFALSAVAGPAGGRFSDRLGPRRAVLTGALFSTVALAGIGLGADRWLVLTLFLAVSGLSVVFIDTGLAILIAHRVEPRLHGLAFGVKEASIPAATLLAGLAVPAIALTLGWRWAFGLGLAPLVALLAALRRLDLPARPPPPSAPAMPEATPPPARSVRLVAAGAALGTAAASGIGVFLTESAVAMGLSQAGAGWLLAGGSVAGIAARVATGVVADRRPGPQLGLISAMMATGAVAMLAGAAGAGPLLVLGTLGSFAGGWGWSGLLFLSLVRASPSAPGAVAGIGLAGLAVGNAMGPFTFGALAQATSFALAWVVAGVMSAVGAAVMWLARPGFQAGAASTSVSE